MHFSSLYRTHIKFHVSNGMTVLELLIAITISIILAGIAIPSFSSAINDKKIRTTSIGLTQTLMLARNHAMNSGVTVIVCQASNDSMNKCSNKRNRNTNWRHGLISYADLNSNNELDSNDNVISVLSNHNDVAIVFNQNGRLRFHNNGGSRSAGFYICSPTTKHQRHLRILYTGRIRTFDEMTENQYKTCLNNAA